MIVEECARAKINLSLEITGRRNDGYHLLKSCVVFAELGDHLTLQCLTDETANDRLEITGHFANNLEEVSDNLVLSAISSLRAHGKQFGLACPALKVSLKKEIPVGAGLGGGSADAAAAIRGAIKLWSNSESSNPFQQDVLNPLLTELGADVPMCFASRPVIATGIGEKLKFLEEAPEMVLLLANPGIHVSTPDVFKKLHIKAQQIQSNISASTAFEFAGFHNDLEKPARELHPEIGECLELLKGLGKAEYVGMSGSGATCFGIFASQAECVEVCEELRQKRPGWWFKATSTGEFNSPD